MRYQNMKRFYKLAQPDGWDFYTGKTINYRDNIGKIITCPDFNKDGDLCSPAFIHASYKPDQCFVGAKIPCSAYHVRGVPIKEDIDKSGFKELYIEKELNPNKIFKWRYKEACNPINPFKIKPPKITKKHISLLKQWDSVWDSVRDSVGDSVRVSVRDSVWVSMWVSVRDSVWVSVRVSVRDSVGDSVWVSVRDSVGDSVQASVRAYIGFIFSPCIKQWKYIDHKKGIYPFQSAVDLWKMGLVSSYDGNFWRLHGGPLGEILWEGKL